MHESTIAKRYASALAELASEQNILDKVQDELSQFQAILNETPEFESMLVNPTTSREEQHQLLATVLEHAKPQTVTSNFLRLLVDKRRMNLLGQMVDNLQKILNEQAGRITVTVESAKALTNTHIQRLEKSLATVTGKEVSLEVNENPELLGGLVIRMGSVMFDDSLRSQLHRLKEIMKG
uniref:ATP synthase subunit delta n=1 Tax=Magnetococcus massalia (strain MO-1) TaxID=451514 RepID=A0A1S7LMP9_MAGMO|nr:F1 sector of membrane-bound ATP synthase, delta subunit [Candidatus Magnetococcus massalia]